MSELHIRDALYIGQTALHGESGFIRIDQLISTGTAL
jgi:hypothetical protein